MRIFENAVHVRHTKNLHVDFRKAVDVVLTRCLMKRCAVALFLSRLCVDGLPFKMAGCMLSCTAESQLQDHGEIVVFVVTKL